MNKAVLMSILLPVNLLLGAADASAASAAEQMIAEAQPHSVVAQDSELYQTIQRDLNEHVDQMLQAWPLRPIMITTGEAYAFHEPYELFSLLSAALPYLEDETRQRAIAMLTGELTRHPPLSGKYYRFEGTPRHAGGSYDIIDEGALPEYPIREPSSGYGLYGLWTFVYYGGQEELPVSQQQDILKAYNALKGRVADVTKEERLENYINKRISRQSWIGRYAHELNLVIQNLTGAARLFTLSGEKELAAEATALLDKALAFRARFPLSKHSFFIPFAGEPVLWHKLSPELSRWLKQTRGDEIKTYMLAPPEHPAKRTIHKFNRNNFWHIAHGEGMIFGETANSWPEGIHALYTIRFYMFDDDARELYRMADMPWCIGDLYYIEKLRLILWRLSGATWQPLTL